MRKLLVVLAGGALSMFAQSGPVIFGARAGASFTNTFGGLTNQFGLSSPGREYLVGPTVGLRLPLGFSVEGDALFSWESLNLGQIAGFGLNAHTDSWQFPVMLKYTAGHGAIAPIFGAGVNFERVTGFNELSSLLLTGSTSTNSVGFVAGGGVQFKAGPVQITPEVRYTHWNNAGLVQSLLTTLAGGTRDQAQVLVGFTF